MAKKKIFILSAVIIAVIFFLLIVVTALSSARIELQVNSDFLQAIEGCDKIVIRDGCYTEHDSYSNKALKIFDDPCDIRDFLGSIRFSIFQGGEVCACMGWPAIDFYRNSERILVTSIKHNYALCTQLRPYDISFTAESKKFFENLVAEIEKAHPEAGD